MRVLRALERVGVDVEVSGAEHLQELDGGAVIIGNHMSTMETVILPALIGTIRPVTFILKDSLFRTPIFRHIVETIDAIGVTRTQPRQDLKTVLQEGGDRLGKGTSIVVFPQTTRALDFDPEQFSSIGVKLAQRAKVPIIPLALSTQAWANGRWLKDFGGIDPSCPVRMSKGGARLSINKLSTSSPVIWRTGRPERHGPSRSTAGWFHHNVAYRTSIHCSSRSASFAVSP